MHDTGAYQHLSTGCWLRVVNAAGSLNLKRSLSIGDSIVSESSPTLSSLGSLRSSFCCCPNVDIGIGGVLREVPATPAGECLHGFTHCELTRRRFVPNDALRGQFPLNLCEMKGLLGTFRLPRALLHAHCALVFARCTSTSENERPKASLKRTQPWAAFQCRAQA